MIITLSGTSNFILGDVIRNELKKSFSVEQFSIGASNYCQWVYNCCAINSFSEEPRLLILDSIVNDENLNNPEDADLITEALVFTAKSYPVIFVEFSNARYLGNKSWTSNFYRKLCRDLNIPYFSFIDCLKFLYRNQSSVPMRDEGHPTLDDLKRITYNYLTPFIKKNIPKSILANKSLENITKKSFKLIRPINKGLTESPIETRLGLRLFYRSINNNGTLHFELPSNSIPIAILLSTHDTYCYARVYNKNNPDLEYNYALHYSNTEKPLFKIVPLTPPINLRSHFFTNIEITSSCNIDANVIASIHSASGNSKPFSYSLSSVLVKVV